MARLKETADRYGELPGGVGRNLAQALHAVNGIAYQLGIARLPFEYGSEFVGSNLEDEIKGQTERYVDREFPKALGMSYWEFKDKTYSLIPNPVPQLEWHDRFPIPIIQITGLNVDTHYKLAGISTPSGYRNRGLYIPEGGYKNTGMQLVWMNDGGMNLDKTVTSVGQILGKDEVLATLDHGVGLLMARPELLAYHNVYLPGSMSSEEDDNITFQTVALLRSSDSGGRNPTLVWESVRSVKNGRLDNDMTASPSMGSATVKKTPRIPKT